MLATLAHEINNTSPTAVKSTTKAGFTSPTTCSFIGTTTAPTAELLAGYCAARRWAIVFISADDCSIETPAFKRAIAWR
jgi:hypothetical protein